MELQAKKKLSEFYDLSHVSRLCSAYNHENPREIPKEFTPIALPTIQILNTNDLTNLAGTCQYAESIHEIVINNFSHFTTIFALDSDNTSLPIGIIKRYREQSFLCLENCITLNRTFLLKGGLYLPSEYFQQSQFPDKNTPPHLMPVNFHLYPSRFSNIEDTILTKFSEKIQKEQLHKNAKLYQEEIQDNRYIVSRTLN